MSYPIPFRSSPSIPRYAVHDHDEMQRRRWSGIHEQLQDGLRPRYRIWIAGVPTELRYATRLEAEQAYRGLQAGLAKKEVSA